jgi:hypothetical protein
VARPVAARRGAGAQRPSPFGRLPIPAPLRDPAQRRPLLGWLGVGVAVRLLLMPFAVSADLLAVYWRSHLIAYDGQVFGSYLVNMGAHYVHALSLRLMRPLLPPPEEVWTDPWWWSDSGALSAQVQRELSTSEHVHQTLFALKVPYLVADLATGLLLLALLAGGGAAVVRRARGGRLGACLSGTGGAAIAVADPRLLRRGFAFWMLSPIGLYASYAFGRYEALAVVFVVAALLSAERGRPWWAALLLGIGVTMRTYPLLLVPVFALVLFRRPLQQALWTAVALAPFAVVLVSNRLLAGTVGELARLQGGVTGSTFFDYSVPVDADGQVFLFFAALLAIYGILAGRAWGWWGAPASMGELWIWLLLTHAAMFGLATFAAHYLMWFTPFVAIAVARRATWRGVLPLHLVQVGLALAMADVLGGPGTTLGLFEPVQPVLTQSLPALREAFLTDPGQRLQVLGLIRTATTVSMALLVVPAIAELAGRRRAAVAEEGVPTR